MGFLGWDLGLLVAWQATTNIYFFVFVGKGMELRFSLVCCFHHELVAKSVIFAIQFNR